MGGTRAADAYLPFDRQTTALIDEPPVVYLPCSLFHVEPDGMAHAIFIDYQGRAMVRAAIDFPVIKCSSLNALRAAVGFQAGHGVVSFVQRKDVAPQQE